MGKGGIWEVAMMGKWSLSLRRGLTAPLLWCLLTSCLAHAGLLYLLRHLEVLPEPVVPLPPPIEVTFVEPSPQPRRSALPPPVGNLPPSLPPPPTTPVAQAPPPRPTPPPPPATPLPSPADSPAPPSETFDPSNTSTDEGLSNLSRWIARLQPELSRPPQSLRLTAKLPTSGCPWDKVGPTVWGVLVNPQGELVGKPELLRSSGYATLNQKAHQLVTSYDFQSYAADSPQALMVEVAWEDTCRPEN